jgi:hypothetical protein
MLDRSMTEPITFRCPDELAVQIKAQMATTGKDKTSVVVGMLRQSMPSLLISERSSLPNIGAVYFVWTSDRLLYIGKTSDLRARFQSHHRLMQFVEAGVEVRVSWFPAQSDDEIPAIESGLIESLEPELNGEVIPGSGNGNLLTFRCPSDLREAIHRRMADSGKNKTAVVIELLRLGLGMSNGSETQVRQEEPEYLQEIIESVVEHKMQSVVDNLNGMLVEMQSKVRDVEQRLGEFERLKAEQEQNLVTDSGSYIETRIDRTAESNDYQQVLIERDQLEERVSDLLLEVENLKDENAVLKQTATDVGPIEPQSGEGLREISDRFLITLKPLERKTAAKLLSRFLKFVGADSHSPTA